MYTKNLFLLFIILFNLIDPVTGQVKRIIVSQDGTGDFKTVQQAINSTPDSSATEIVIFIKKGVYKEKLQLPVTKINLHFIGEDLQTTILTYDDYASKKDSTGNNIGTSGSSSFFIFGSDFTAENISFENSAGPVGQAVAVRITGDRVKFINCRFIGYQDTLYTHGAESRQYYLKCFIQGTVDFIFGSSTALFDSCTIYGKSGGFYTAASTPQNNLYGYVFYRCHFTGDAPAGSFYLGRPWRPYAKTVLLECKLDEQVKLEGWNNWGKVENEQTVQYSEYANTGKGASTTRRVSWSRQLTAEEAKQYRIHLIFRDWIPYQSNK